MDFTDAEFDTGPWSARHSCIGGRANVYDTQSQIHVGL